MNNVMYIVINKDLNMSPGKIGAHTAHAVFDYMYNRSIDTDDKFFDDFKYNGDTICILKASQKDMLKFEQQGYTAVRDSGRTEIEPNSLTAINLGIYDKNKGVPKFIQRMRLL